MDETKQSETEFLCVDEKITVDSLIMDGTLTLGDDNETTPGKTKEPSTGRQASLSSLNDNKIKDFEGAEKGKGKRHRRRKGKKTRQWKPYYKLTWKEKGELEDREAIRATRRRAERMAHGQPAAPYNTTQFLIEDRIIRASEPDLGYNHRQHRDASVSSDDFYSSPEDEITFMEKEFSEEYERSHAERLHSMSKAELVEEFIVMESRIEELQELCTKYSKQIELRSPNKCDNQTGTEDLLPQTEENYNELIRLQLLVDKLQMENELLRSNSLTESLLKSSSSTLDNCGET